MIKPRVIYSMMCIYDKATCYIQYGVSIYDKATITYSMGCVYMIKPHCYTQYGCVYMIQTQLAYSMMDMNIVCVYMTLFIYTMGVYIWQGHTLHRVCVYAMMTGAEQQHLIEFFCNYNSTDQTRSNSYTQRDILPTLDSVGHHWRRPVRRYIYTIKPHVTYSMYVYIW